MPRSPHFKAAVDEIAREIPEGDQLLAAGFAAFRSLVLLPYTPDGLISDYRIAFMAGVQYAVAIIAGLDDTDDDPTEADLERLRRIDVELKRFAAEMRLASTPTQGEA